MFIHPRALVFLSWASVFLNTYYVPGTAWPLQLHGCGKQDQVVVPRETGLETLGKTGLGLLFILISRDLSLY